MALALVPAQVEILGFSAEVQMVEQVGDFSFDPWALALRSRSRALALRFEWSSRLGGFSPQSHGL